MLLDAASLYFRAFYGVPDTVTAPDGSPVNAVRGFLDAIARLVDDRHPTHLVAAWDNSWRPDWRVEAVPTYKAHRVAEEGGEDTPPALDPQVPIIVDVLDALGICRIGVDGYEADDVIGTLATISTEAVEIVTGDRDLFQLVDDAKPIRVLYVAKGVGNREVIDEAAVTRRYDIPGRRYADFATLRGDPSDGLPGVPGVGEKTAAALVRGFGDIEAIVAAARGDGDGLPKGTQAKLVSAAAYLERAADVVRVACDLPVGDFDARLPASPRDPAALVELSERWGLRGSLNRVLNAMAGQATAE